VPIWVATGFAVLNLVVVLTLLPETHPVSERRVLPRKRELNPFAQIARVIGSLQALQSLGSFLGPPLAGLAYDLLGQTSPFFGSAGLLVVVLLLVTRSPLEHTTG